MSDQDDGEWTQVGTAPANLKLVTPPTKKEGEKKGEERETQKLPTKVQNEEPKIVQTQQEQPASRKRGDSLLDQVQSAFQEDPDNNQYYDEIGEDDLDDWQNPINLDDLQDDEYDDELAQEKIYNICSSGKKTQIQPTELYGFFFWILTAVGFIVYQVWAYVPDYVLNNFGIHYIPNKYLSVAVPAWASMTVVCVIMLYLSYSMMHTHSR